MAYKISRVNTAYEIPTDIEPQKEWGPSFSRLNGFAIQVHKKYWMSVFINADLFHPKLAERRAILQRQEGVIAHCISCVGEDWEVRSEPITKGAGFIVYTAKGKPIGRGIANLNKGGNLQFTAETLYPGITNSFKIEFSIHGDLSNDGGWFLGGFVTVSDDR